MTDHSNETNIYCPKCSKHHSIVEFVKAHSIYSPETGIYTVSWRRVECWCEIVHQIPMIPEKWLTLDY